MAVTQTVKRSRFVSSNSRKFFGTTTALFSRRAPTLTPCRLIPRFIQLKRISCTSASSGSEHQNSSFSLRCLGWLMQDWLKLLDGSSKAIRQMSRCVLSEYPVLKRVVALSKLEGFFCGKIYRAPPCCMQKRDSPFWIYKAWDFGEEEDKEVQKFPLNRGDKPRRCEQHF